GYDHRLTQDVLAQDLAVALDRRHAFARAGQIAAHLAVRLVLVAQAALEPPALPGELRRRDRQPLLLHHLDRDRLERSQPRGAAELASADADPARRLRPVARSDLLHLDAGLQRVGDLTSEGAEVEPLLGRQEHGGPGAVRRGLDLDELR